jgi:hypothetical protein
VKLTSSTIASAGLHSQIASTALGGNIEASTALGGNIEASTLGGNIEAKGSIEASTITPLSTLQAQYA